MAGLEILDIDLPLVEKYNVPGPRYTSYPTALKFQEDPPSFEIKEYIRQRNSQPGDYSIYIHIPFCFSLCWYCGCTKIITRDASRGSLYLDYLEKEMDLWREIIPPHRRMVQLHFGGGTPTFLTPDELRRLGSMLHERFSFDPSAEISVEIDPRRLTRDHVKALKAIGCTRASMGVQDTDPEVQHAIHRIQPNAQNGKVVEWLREEGFESINLDLIYGLPRQTQSTFMKTLEDVHQLNPDRLAIYSYAHLPRLMPAQRLLNEAEFPSGREKIALLMMAVDYLMGQGYEYIGMDHFARHDDELSKALAKGSLQRNFQGYSTRAGVDLYGMGMSGISKIGEWYVQNSKVLEDYYGSLDQENHPFAKAYPMTMDDRIRADAIMNIMCRDGFDYEDFSNTWRIDAKFYFLDEIEKLEEAEVDGLVNREPGRLQVTPRGRFFLRNIAMIFDKYLGKKTVNRYSKTI